MERHMSLQILGVMMTLSAWVDNHANFMRERCHGFFLTGREALARLTYATSCSSTTVLS